MRIVRFTVLFVLFLFIFFGCATNTRNSMIINPYSYIAGNGEYKLYIETLIDGPEGGFNQIYMLSEDATDFIAEGKLPRIWDDSLIYIGTDNVLPNAIWKQSLDLSQPAEHLYFAPKQVYSSFVYGDKLYYTHYGEMNLDWRFAVSQLSSLDLMTNQHTDEARLYILPGTSGYVVRNDKIYYINSGGIFYYDLNTRSNDSLLEKDLIGVISIFADDFNLYVQAGALVYQYSFDNGTITELNFGISEFELIGVMNHTLYLNVYHADEEHSRLYSYHPKSNVQKIAAEPYGYLQVSGETVISRIVTNHTRTLFDYYLFNENKATFKPLFANRVKYEDSKKGMTPYHYITPMAAQC